MTYEQIFPDHESLRTHINTLRKQRVSLYSDYGKAVFGYQVHDINPELDDAKHMSCSTYLEIAARVNSEPFQGQIFVWMKFGKELTSETILVSSISDLLAYEEANKTGELYRFSDSCNVSIIDYSKAAEGKSVIVSLTPKAFASRDFRESVNFPAMDWLHTIGIIPPIIRSVKSLPGRVSGTVSSVASRSVSTRPAQQIRPRSIFRPGPK